MLTDTLHQIRVVVESTGAVTSVTRNMVNTHATLTHLRIKQLALIHICSEVNHTQIRKNKCQKDLSHKTVTAYRACAMVWIMLYLYN